MSGPGQKLEDLDRTYVGGSKHPSACPYGLRFSLDLPHPSVTRSKLRELRRVLKRGGRLVVGEILLDPHRVSFEELRRFTEAVGLYHERTLKGILGYLAAFRAS